MSGMRLVPKMSQSIMTRRQTKGWTRKALADRAGVTVSSLRRYEMGLAKKIPHETWKKINALLPLSEADIWEISKTFNEVHTLEDWLKQHRGPEEWAGAPFRFVEGDALDSEIDTLKSVLTPTQKKQLLSMAHGLFRLELEDGWVE